MAIPFLSNIDLNRNQALQLVLHNKTSDPSPAVEGQVYWNSSENKAYVYNGSAWINVGGDITRVNITAGAGLTGTVDTTAGEHTQTIDVVGGDGITVNADEIEATVDGVTIGLNNTNGAGALFVKDNSITLAKLEHQANNTVLKMNGSGVPTAGTVDTANITDDAVTGAKIGDDEINSEHIAAGAVDLEHMSDNSVDSDQYVDGSIDTDHIGDEQVTLAKMAHIATQTMLGRNTSGTGDVEAVTPANFRGFLKTALNGNLATVTFGDSNDTITIPGTLIVTGDTKYHNETIQIVEDNTLAFRAGDSNDHEILLTAADADSDKTITLPNLTGHVALLQNAATELIDATPAELNILDGATLTTTELNTLDGVNSTLTAAELNILDGVTATTAELNYSDGVTSNIQDQLDALEPAANKVTKKLSGDGTNTTYTISHGLGTNIVMVQVLHYGDNGSGATYDVVHVEVQKGSDTNKLDIIFGTAPTTSEDYLVLVSKFPAIS